MGKACLLNPIATNPLPLDQMNHSITFIKIKSIIPPFAKIHINGDDQLIRKLKGVQFLDWHPQQGLLIGKSEICENTQVYTDLYQLQDDQLTPPDRMRTYCSTRHLVTRRANFWCST